MTFRAAEGAQGCGGGGRSGNAGARRELGPLAGRCSNRLGRGRAISFPLLGCVCVLCAGEPVEEGRGGRGGRGGERKSKGRRRGREERKRRLLSCSLCLTGFSGHVGLFGSQVKFGQVGPCPPVRFSLWVTGVPPAAEHLAPRVRQPCFCSRWVVVERMVE